LLNISRITHEKIKMSNYAIKRNFRAACPSVEMLKGYMFRERLGAPALTIASNNCMSQAHLERITTT